MPMKSVGMSAEPVTITLEPLPLEYLAVNRTLPTSVRVNIARK